MGEVVPVELLRVVVPAHGRLKAPKALHQQPVLGHLSPVEAAPQLPVDGQIGLPGLLIVGIAPFPQDTAQCLVLRPVKVEQGVVRVKQYSVISGHRPLLHPPRDAARLRYMRTTAETSMAPTAKHPANPRCGAGRRGTAASLPGCSRAW